MKTPQTIASFHQILIRGSKSIRRRFRDFATWCAIVAMLHFQLAVPTRLFANPVDGSVVAGSATINQQGNVLDVMQQSDRAVINWGQFSIGAGEIANFHLPSASSAVLNRVMTPGMPSEIFGALNSNGQVFLINPSGVMIGPSGVINAGGFTASALDIPNADFMRGGNLHFQGNGTGSIINQGSIITGAGGVALIGGSVVNQGTIVSDGGTVSLVVGDNVTLSAAGTYVQAEMSVLLNGLSEYAGVINNSGVIRATGAANIGGEVYLVNPGGTVLQAGLIAAQKQAADGALAGGAVKIDAAEAQIGGTIEASGSTGGRVEITGQDIALTAATIDASGDHGGGAVRIGGGVQGKDPALRNAQSTTVDAASLISADSRLSGNAGSVVVYAAGKTDFAGQISARAFGSSGDGGFVEVSGRNTLILNGTVDTSSLAGLTGTLLLDPTNFDVLPPGSGDDYVSYISADTLVDLLNSNNVVIQTAVLTPVDDPGTGTISVQPGAEVIWSSDNSLTFLAHGDIFVYANVQNDGIGSVNLVAGWDGVTGSPDPGVPGVIPDGPPSTFFDLAAILADPASYGNTTYGDGSVLITDGDWVGVAVGSAYGDTNVLANHLWIQGRSDDFGYAQLGFHNEGGDYDTMATGNINVYLKGDLIVTAGTWGAEEWGVYSSFAQIGHGGWRESGNGPTDYSGNILLSVGGNVLLEGSTGIDTYAQIGHGGSYAEGNLSGDISLTVGGAIGLRGGYYNGSDDDGAGAYAQIGHGGLTSNGDLSGAIEISATGIDHPEFGLLAAILAAGEYADTYALIGHGGSYSYNNFDNNPFEGNVSGDITLNLGDQLRLSGGADEFANGAFAQIGHGGLGRSGDLSGNITITTDTAIGLFGGIEGFTYAQIGHGGAMSGTYLGSFGNTYNLSGAIQIAAMGIPDFDPDGGIAVGLLAGGGDDAYALIGHGGTYSGSEYNFTTGGILLDLGDQLRLSGGAGSHAFAQIGHGGDGFGYDSSLIDGAITVYTDGKPVTLYGGSNYDTYAQIGHGGAGSYGTYGSDMGLITLSLTGLSDEPVPQPIFGELKLNAGTGPQAYTQIGHGGIDSYSDLLGDIKITAGLTTLTGGSGSDGGAYALIGHGGSFADGGRYGNITLDVMDTLQLQAGLDEHAFAQIGHGGEGDVENDIPIFINAGGNIQVTAEKSVILNGGSNTGTYARIGHGGIYAIGDLSDVITLNVKEELQLNAGTGPQAFVQIGHGGLESEGNLSGAIEITAVGTTTLAGGSGRNAYALIGHGGANSFGDKNDGITLDLGDELQLNAGAGESAFAQIGHGGLASGGNLSGAIDIAAVGMTTLAGGGDSFAYALIGHGGANSLGEKTGNITLTLSDALQLNAGAYLCFAQIGHGGLADFSTNISGDIALTAAKSVTLNAGGNSYAYAQIGHGGTLTGGTMSGLIDVAVGGNLNMTGDPAGWWAQIGHGGQDSTMTVSGNIEVKVNDSAMLTQGLIGHFTSGGYPGGNTWIGVGQGPSNTGTITADITSLFNSAPAGELRFYMPDRNSYQIAAGTLLNGVAGAAPGTVPLPNEQGFYTFGNGPYVPTVGNYALYFTPVAPNPVVIVGISPGQFATDQFTRYQNYWESIATLPTGGVRYLGGITYGAHRHWFTGLTDLDSFNLFGPPANEPPPDGAGDNQ